ncbi:hypothetical protein D9613_009897 [Agrocybe pediades]|uniref:Uncharacterized protein n=1 Tax=Agrocybe pediades TaxID=84607 RepID=A0A8H4QWI6_9AGAR|nr:hypothetical protein D9613_009897 [Agrocybe pediades]
MSLPYYLIRNGVSKAAARLKEKDSKIVATILLALALPLRRTPSWPTYPQNLPNLPNYDPSVHLADNGSLTSFEHRLSSIHPVDFPRPLPSPHIPILCLRLAAAGSFDNIHTNLRT